MTAKPGDPRIELIVEGKADLDAVPVLLRKHLHGRNEFRDVLGKPIPTHGVTNATKVNGIEGFVATASCRPGCKGILVVLDSDDECVVDRAQALAKRIEGTVPQPVIFALAVRNYEDWLYTSIEALSIGDILYRDGASGLSEIKHALRAIGESYSKPLWQPRLTQRIDIELAKTRSASFSRLLDRFDSLVALLPE